MKFDWPEFCATLRSSADYLACDDTELRAMLARPTPPLEHTDEIGRPLPGSSLVSEHPDLPNYRRVAAIRHQLAVDAKDALGIAYSWRVLQFLESYPGDSPFFIVTLSTKRECYETLFFPSARLLTFAPVKYLEGRNRDGSTTK